MFQDPTTFGNNAGTFSTLLGSIAERPKVLPQPAQQNNSPMPWQKSQGGSWGQGTIPKLFSGGGKFADGGDPPVNQPSLVGERGPEIFVPKVPGTIIPNNTLQPLIPQAPQQDQAPGLQAGLRPLVLNSTYPTQATGSPTLPNKNSSSIVPSLPSIVPGSPSQGLTPLGQQQDPTLVSELQKRMQEYYTPYDKAKHGFWGNLKHNLGQTGFWQQSGTETNRRAQEAATEKMYQDLITNQNTTVKDYATAFKDTAAGQKDMSSIKQPDIDWKESTDEKGNPIWVGLDKKTIDPATGLPVAYKTSIPVNKTTPEADKPIAAADIASRNAILSDQYQQRNQGKPLPTEFQLRPGDTEKRYADIEAALKNIDSTQGSIDSHADAQAASRARLGEASINKTATQDFARNERGRSNLDKMEDEYRKAEQSNEALLGMIDQAVSGNKQAAQMLPLAGALEITTAAGVHRINRTEVDQYAGAGAIYDRVYNAIHKGVFGTAYDKSITSDMQKLTDLQESAAYDKYLNTYESTIKRYGLDPSQEAPIPPPTFYRGKDADVQVPIDGKLHWANSKTKKVYGEVR